MIPAVSSATYAQATRVFQFANAVVAFFPLHYDEAAIFHRPASMNWGKSWIVGNNDADLTRLEWWL
jgi:hypothetical protein